MVVRAPLCTFGRSDPIPCVPPTAGSRCSTCFTALTDSAQRVLSVSLTITLVVISGSWSPTTLCRYRHVGPPIYFSHRGMQLNERPWHKQSVLLNNPR